MENVESEGRWQAVGMRPSLREISEAPYQVSGNRSPFWRTGRVSSRAQLGRTDRGDCATRLEHAGASRRSTILLRSWPQAKRHKGGVGRSRWIDISNPSRQSARAVEAYSICDFVNRCDNMPCTPTWRRVHLRDQAKVSRQSPVFIPGFSVPRG